MFLSWVKIGSLLMFMGVLLGAFGAHLISSRVPAKSLETFRTGIFYHIVHSLAVFIVAWLSTQSNDPKIHYAGVYFMTGITFFSGSLYLVAITETKWFGILTPVGGLAFLAGWALLFYSQYTIIF